MSMQNAILVSCAMQLFLQAAAVGGLSWQSREAELTASATNRQVVPEFSFTNSGDRTVTINSIDAACDCAVSRSLY